MATHLALLRGVNVGGHHRLPMADLRALMVRAGHADVRTYIQSGNVVFTPGSADPPDRLADELADALEETVGFRPVVVVCTASGWASVMARDPYSPDAEPRTVHVAVRREDFTTDEQGVLAELLDRHRAAGGPDHLTVDGATLWLHTPQGIGRSRLAESLSRVGAGMAAVTMRNRATAQRLLELLSPGS